MPTPYEKESLAKGEGDSIGGKLKIYKVKGTEAKRIRWGKTGMLTSEVTEKER